MQITSVIDIALWDKAGWYATFFGVCPDGLGLPLLGPVFRDAESSRRIFERWRKVLGELDVHEIIQASIIEGEIPGEVPGYTVFIGTNPTAAAGLASIRKADESGLIAMTGRFHRMQPEPGSPHLSNFKAAYERSNAYLLLPAVQDGTDVIVMMDLAIEKKRIRFVQAADLSRNDDEFVVLKRPEDALPVPKGDANEDEADQPPITATLAVLEAELAAGRVKRYVDPMLADSLADVRYDDGGQVILESVNPMLLTLAKQVTDDVLERHALSVPLRDVQAEYAKLLERFFRQPFEEMTKHGVTPHDVAEDFASSTERTQMVCGMAPGLHDALAEFWRANGLTVLAHLRSQSALRAVYGGNLFPHFKSNFASNLALYADTLVLPDPLIGATGMCNFLTPAKLTYFFMRHGLTAMAYKSLALADVTIPIVVFVPDQISLADSIRESLHSLSLDDIRLHAERIFDRKFADIDAVRRHIGNFSNEHELARAVKDASRFVFDVDANPMPFDQIACLMQDSSSYQGVAALRDLGSAVSRSLEGRFMQATDAITRAGLYGGIPVMDAPTSWQYLLWKYEYAAVNREIPVDYREMMVQHVIHGQLASMPALQNVSNETVIELRRRSMLVGLRDAFRKGVATVKNASAEAFDEVAQQVSQNLRTALTEYEDDVRKLAAERDGLLGEIALSSGGLVLGIAAAAYGGVPLGIAGAIAAATGVGTFKDVYSKLQGLRTTRARLAQNPVGLLFRA